MELVRLNNIATTIQGQSVNLVLKELYIGTEQQNITTPWLLEVVDENGTILRTVDATGVDAGAVFEAWYNSEAGQAIRGILLQQSQALLQDTNSNIRKQLDFFATLNQ